MDWKEYQEQAAEFFRSLGLNAETDVCVSGARAKHDVDVMVSFDRFGIAGRWIVECKLWSSRVPKEKVLALQAIVQDVGADKGILLSETGFQAGAVASAQSTNIMLADLATLQEIAADEIEGMRWLNSREKLEAVMDKLRSMRWRQAYRTSDRSGGLMGHAPPDYFSMVGTLALFEMAIRDGRKGLRPLIICPPGGDEPVRTDDVNEFFASLEQAITVASDYLEKYKAYLPHTEYEGTEPSLRGDG